MRHDNRIVLILFIMAVSTVFLMYAAFTADEKMPQANETPVIPGKEEIGKTVYVEGIVAGKKMTLKGEHLILTITCTDNTVLPVFIPKTSGAAIVFSEVEIGDKIGVKGVVEEYNGALEIVLKRETNFHRFSS